MFRQRREWRQGRTRGAIPDGRPHIRQRRRLRKRKRRWYPVLDLMRHELLLRHVRWRWRRGRWHRRQRSSCRSLRRSGVAPDRRPLRRQRDTLRWRWRWQRKLGWRLRRLGRRRRRWRGRLDRGRIWFSQLRWRWRFRSRRCCCVHQRSQRGQRRRGVALRPGVISDHGTANDGFSDDLGSDDHSGSDDLRWIAHVDIRTGNRRLGRGGSSVVVVLRGRAGGVDHLRVAVDRHREHRDARVPTDPATRANVEVLGGPRRPSEDLVRTAVRSGPEVARRDRRAPIRQRR